MRLDHVQLAIPPGSEEACRTFYCGLLGWTEVPKPPALAARGGLWLRAGEADVHLGVEQDFRPARKAHPAFVVDDLDDIVRRLEAAGHTPEWDDGIPGVRRFYVADAVGNRLEFMEG
jgi:catechol 2,3-dioxygenase-like lactoylglutathione lyase family enzyme